ncbi:hypothetical protein VULLAG_LOCUS310 [Vulpes lagopus]
MPWTTAPPTYRSIPSLRRLHLRRKVRSPHPCGLAGPFCLAQRGQGGILAAGGCGVGAGRPHSCIGTSRVSAVAPVARGPHSPRGRSIPEAADAPARRSCWGALPTRGGCGRSRGRAANFSPAHVLAGRPAAPARDGAPRLGSPRSPSRSRGERCRPRRTDQRAPRASGPSRSASSPAARWAPAPRMSSPVPRL